MRSVGALPSARRDGVGPQDTVHEETASLSGDLYLAQRVPHSSFHPVP